MLSGISAENIREKFGIVDDLTADEKAEPRLVDLPSELTILVIANVLIFDTNEKTTSFAFKFIRIKFESFNIKKFF
uniref:SKP1 component dimerisation domain-containing protein n=1 Tax=Meloidogyne incognita TaxID=6306 RepID=A0A914NTE6_MELIC